MKVLVTGGAGYVGSHVVAALLDAGHEPVVYDNLSEGHREAVPGGGGADGVPLVQGDIADGDALKAAMSDHGIEAVAHLAANCYVGESVEKPLKYYRNNLIGSLALLEAAVAHGAKRLVFSSSAATYGQPDADLITEDTPQAPVNPYGETKLAFERALSYAAPAFGLAPVSLRYFNASGCWAERGIGEDHDPETHLIPLVLRAALTGGEIKIFGTDYDTPDGTAVRDYVHVRDLAAAHLLALEAGREGEHLAFNLGSETGFSVRELIDLAREVTGRDIKALDAPRRAGDPARLVASNSLAKDVLGWAPRHSDLRSILASAWEWMSANPDGYSAAS